MKIEYKMETLKWLLKLRWIWFFIFLMIAIYPFYRYFDFWLECGSDRLRVYGLGLQIFGTATIAFSLRQKLYLFKKGGFRKLFADWFSIRPFFRSRKNVVVETQMGDLEFNGYAPRVLIGPQEDLKDVIQYFKGEIDHINRTMDEDRNENRLKFKRVEASMNASNTKIEFEVAETNRKVSEASVSSVSMDIFGVFAILVGLVLGTVPDLVDKLFRWVM